MEQQREARNPIIIFLLIIAHIHLVSSSGQNLYTFTTTIDIGTAGVDQVTDYVSSQPLNITTSIYQDSTTYVPVSTSIQEEGVLDSSETKVVNRYAQPSYQHNESTGEDDDPEEPPDHVIPYSEHEEARDVSTQPKYIAPGVWAKPPSDKDIPLDFVPTKLHAQVRGTHTVKRLPQREAIESAETDEEKRNAPRLRQVVTNSKVNTVYTEEGYEDSAYDHAGHVRDADFHEGFAHKLHDRNGHNTSRKKGQQGDLVPNEFEEYEEDHHDHTEGNRKIKETASDGDNLIGYGRDWEGSVLDPKLIAENSIQKLEEDIEKDAEETERSAKNYENAQESKLHNDSSESEESHGENDLKDEGNKPAEIKEKKSKLRAGKAGTTSKGAKKSRKIQQTKKKLHRENYETTTIPSDKIGSIVIPHDFVTNPSSSEVYSIDQTTVRYVAPVETASFQHVDQPTTVSYSHLFWDYFKTRQEPSTESYALVTNSTTTNPQAEERTPLAVATIDGHGPYLLITKEETTTSPSTFLNSRGFYPQDLFSDHVELDPTSAQGYNRHLLGQSDDVDFVSGVIATSTVATFTSVRPLLPQSLPSLNSEEYLSPTSLSDSTVSSSTPTVMTLNFTREAYSRIADYEGNPFLRPILDNSNIAVTKNKTKYKVLARSNPSYEKKPVKSVAHQSLHQPVRSPSTFKEEDYKKVRDELKAKYNKMLNYIINSQKIQSLPEKKKLVLPEDVTLMRPPIRQQVAYPILPDRPAVDHSSASIESQSREANWRGLLQDQHRSQPIKLPLHSDLHAYIQPMRPIYRKNKMPFPATRLLPPPPLPLANTYANYYSNKQNDNYPSYVGGKPQQQRDNAFRYFPLIPEASWRTRSRRKRSDESEFRDGAVKAAANNGVTNDGKLKQRDEDMTRLASPARSRGGTSMTLMDGNGTVANGERRNIVDARETLIDSPRLARKLLIRSAKRAKHTNVEEPTKNKRSTSQDETRSRENPRNGTDRKSHDELLYEAPKISGDVIDKEIEARFNEDNNETSAKTKKEGKIEIEIPSFDYVEELAGDRLVEPIAMTETAIDSKKYPFYNDKDVPSASALKYVIDPGTVPRKTSRGMEFYDSRNDYKRCDEVEPSLDVLPEKEEPDPERGPQEDLPRLRGLGDKLDCFKAKYFDEDPLDNPLFAEKSVDDPAPPSELNPTKFASKILVLPEENDDYVVHRVSKKPERNGRQRWNRNRPYETHESIRVNYRHDPQTGRGRNAYLHTVRGSKPSNAMRRVKNRRSKPKVTSTTTQSPKLYQTASYQNQVYEDVMGNIRNMANAYQVYEMTTLPPLTQILATAGSENILKVANVTSSPSEKTTLMPEITDVTTNAKSSEIEGLIPPKYSAPRQITGYRKYRQPTKSRASLLRSPNLSRIIAHHHSIKINKRSITNDTTKNFSENTNNKNEKATGKEFVKVDSGNDTVVKSAKGMMKNINATSELLDLETEESRQVSTKDQGLSTSLKIDDKKRRKNFIGSEQKSEPSQKIIYTIRDRVRYSKPKWDTKAFGKFNASPNTVDEDSRRKEPRYNHFRRKKKLIGDQRNNSTITNSTENTSGIESAMSSIGGRESSTTEDHRAEESVVHQTIYRRKDKYPESEKTDSVVDMESEESLFNEEEEEQKEEEEKEKEEEKEEEEEKGEEEEKEEEKEKGEEEEKGEEQETTTNAYQVYENIDEDVVTTTTTKSTNLQNSKEIQKLREYLESDPPGYAETFPEETTTPSSKHRANTDDESEDREEKQDEETDYPKNLVKPWDEDSAEKAEEQVETPTKAKSSSRDDDSEELSSKEEEEEGSNKDQTFFTYRKPSLIEDDKDDERSEKRTFYKPFPFSRYKSKIKKESEEDSEEENEDGKEDYVFPWHADKEGDEDNHKWLQKFDRYEYPWERRERMAREREKNRKRSHRLRKLIFDDEDEEESVRHNRPVYPWERYDVPTNIHVNTRRDISRKYADDNEESSTEQLPLTKFSSRYSFSNVKPKTSSAREISRSIKTLLEKDIDDESKEEESKEVENHSPSFARKSSPVSDRGISRGTLVPEDVTQPPRRKKARKKTAQVDRYASSDSHFDSKKLKSKEITDESREMPAEEYKLNESNSDDSQIETTSSQPSQLFNSTKEISFATEPPRKKRRRIISKNNSTISLDNVPAESITEPAKKKRRRPPASTTTSATPSASVNLDENKSVPTPVHPQAETSTPKTRTIEHRSRVSKEKIVTKTTYPDEAENFNSMKMNVTSARKEPAKNLNTKSRRRKKNNKHNDNNGNPSDKKKLMEQKDGKEANYHVNFKSSESEDNPLKNFGMKKEEVKKINDFNVYDGIINDENINNGDFRMLSETAHAVSNLIQNIPPIQVRNDRVNERTENGLSRMKKGWEKRNSSKETDEGEKKENVEERRSSLKQAKFIKDPERRLYYYIERK